jgi:PadR family transcriptional regulator PadR
VSNSSAVRITGATLSVLGALLENPSGNFYGFDLLNQANIKSGTLYPILARLESAGWVKSHWEETDPRTLSRPRRRYYVLTPRGRAYSTAAIQRRAEEQAKTKNRSRPKLAPEPA